MSLREENWRIFIAVPLADTLKGTLDDWAKTYQSQGMFRKWVHPSDLHITVQFLGDTPTSNLKKLGEMLREAVKGFGAIQLEAKGVGTFGRPGQPSILWAGVGGETTRLGELHRLVTGATSRLGYIPEERAYQPHITLARKYQGDVPFVQGALEIPAGFGEWTAETLVVYRTRMGQSPMYEVIDRVAF
ncbi:RNA 2',3'-cyclic phosphodiesterase [Paenibacillus tuaregi]|uniref:RNA 2',3'-cyclic phosphodiesterase n=1 Tax=Paenibacillus tuaregi TaxID=1816681 RepID=UPI000838AF78|nr:RNA 2',3'-cyclic phosphodiesterase [Paenibacillus tuaregi]